MKIKAGILSLGCPRNLVDSEVLIGRLRSKGCEITGIREAQVAIINTCGFIEDAKRESIDAILDALELKKKGKLKKVILAGCLVQRYPSELLENFGKEVDAFIGRIDFNSEGNIKAGKSGDIPRGKANSCQKPVRFLLTPPHMAYLKISEGCVNFCSYCVIPKIKGRLNSRSKDSLIKEVKLLDSRGIRELNIIGQDITNYGVDINGKPSLAVLLKEIIKNTVNIRWIRLLYLHPKRVDDELLELISGENKVCKYIDLPFQHINDRILKLMNRLMSRREIELLIAKIRRRVPGVALRTAFIAGFPSETEEEFKELLDFVSEEKFERLGAFAFSPEEGTVAYKLAGRIPRRVKVRRLSSLMSRQREISNHINSRLLNQRIEVIIDEEEKESEGAYLGRTRSDAPEVDGMVYLTSTRRLKRGDIVRARVTDTLDYDLVADVINC